MTSGSNCRHLKRPETEGVSRSIELAHRITPPKLQHFRTDDPSGSGSTRPPLAQIKRFVKVAHVPNIRPAGPVYPLLSDPWRSASRPLGHPRPARFRHDNEFLSC